MPSPSRKATPCAIHPSNPFLKPLFTNSSTGAPEDDGANENNIEVRINIPNTLRAVDRWSPLPSNRRRRSNAEEKSDGRFGLLEACLTSLVDRVDNSSQKSDSRQVTAGLQLGLERQGHHLSQFNLSNSIPSYVIWKRCRRPSNSRD